jgi:hypothetical protein
MITPIVKAAVSLAGLNRQAVAKALELSSAQAISNKYNRDSFSGGDLIRIAAACGFRLAFVDDKGKAVLTFPEPEPEAKEG